MFNYSLILVSLISFIILISCDYNSNDLKNNGLIVKKCETYKYLLSNSDYSKNILHYKTEFYNNKEMLLTEITYSPIGEKHSVTIEENPYYLHKTIEELSLHNDSIFAIMYEIKKVMSSKKQSLLNKIDRDTVKTNIYEIDIIKYDSSLRKIERFYRREKDFTLNIIWKYNAVGNLVETIDKYHNSSMDQKTLYYYNNSGLLTKTQSIKNHEAISREVKYYYDGKNRLVKEIANVPSTKPYSISIYFYDDNGNTIKDSIYWIETSTSKVNFYKYNNLNRKIFESDDLFHTTFVYDDSNRLIDETCYFKENILVSKFLYSYDNNNRMVEKYEYSQRKGISIMFYMYDYY